MTMRADDLQPAALAAEHNAEQAGDAAQAGAPPNAQSLERWTRAVAAPWPQDVAARQGAGLADTQTRPPALATPSAASSSTQQSKRWSAEGFEASFSSVLTTPSRDQVGQRTRDVATLSAPLFGASEAVASRVPPQMNEAEGLSLSASAGTDAAVDAQTARALPLSALRGLYASHQQGKADAAQAFADAAEAPNPQAPTSGLSSADLPMPRLHPASSAESTQAADGVGAANHAEQLQSLIESCCSRLWVSESSSGSPHGVMLDLGRWMPGCTIEVAKAAGVLCITLRGVDDGQRSRVGQELDSLGEALAQKLGCRVVAAVTAQKESS
jgi:hypothetical protein